MTTSRHILFVCHSRSCHGAEMVLLQSIRVALEAGYRATLLLSSVAIEEGLEAKAANISRLTILHAPYKAAGKGWLRTSLISLYNAYAVSKIAHWAKCEKVDVVWSGTSVTLLGATVAARCGIKHVWHFHEPVDSLFGWHDSMKSIYRHWIQQPKTQLIFISHTQKKEWAQTLYPTQISGEVVYNPVRVLPIVERTESECVRFGYMGNFESRKNLPFLLRTFELLAQCYPNVSLCICGAENEDQISALYASTTLRYPQLNITPKRMDVEQFYAQTDVLVLPSYKETMPLVVIEAMMAQVAVIQTDQSGMQELFTDEQDCLYFSPFDQDQLLRHMERCISKSERKRLCQQGYCKASNYQFNEQYTQSVTRICAL